MTVKIVTESVSDLPSAVTEELGITVIPAYIHFGTETYRDGIDLTTEEFYSKLVHSRNLPSTAAPSPRSFADAYDRLAEQTDEILTITVSSKLSAIYEVALNAVGLMKHKCRVEVIDSQLGCMAEGLVVISAAKAAQAGASLNEVMTIAQRNIPRTEIYFSFNTLEYLKRGGRIGRAQALMGSILKVNPILTLKDGEAYPVGRERSRAQVIDHLYHFAMGYSHIEEMAVEDATTPDETEMLVERLSSRFPRERIYRAKVSPAVGRHVGPHVLAVSILGDRE